MTLRYFTVSLAILLLPFCWQAACVAEQNPEDIKDFIDSVVKQLSAAPFNVPQLKGASFETIETHDGPDGSKFHLCWLKGKGRRVGYILVQEGIDKPVLIAASATIKNADNVLDFMTGQLPEKQKINFSRTGLFSFVTGVPLVATSPATLGGEKIDLAEGSCCVVSVLHFLQYVKGIPLFGHIDYFGSSEYLSVYQEKLGKKDKVEEQYKQALARAKDAGWRPFSEEFKETLAKENILPGKTPEERLAYRTRARRIATGIRHQRLLNPLTPQERFDLMLGEEKDIARVTASGISKGARDALLMQQDYLEGNPAKLGSDIEKFFKTRGFEAAIRTMPLKEIPKNLLPAIILGKDKQAGILLGHVEIDGVAFALVFYPSTGNASKTTLAAKARTIGGDKAIIQPEKAPNEEVKGYLSRLKALVESRGIAEDIPSSFPEAFANGVHMVRVEFMQSCQCLHVGEVVPGANWGAVPLTERKE